jgi:hypothetical protein
LPIPLWPSTPSALGSAEYLLACAVVVELLVETIALRTYNHVLILTSPSPCAKNINRAFAHAHCVFLPSHPWTAIRASSPAALASSILQARLRSLPVLVYSVGGAVDAGGVGGDSYRLDASVMWVQPGQV